MRSKPGVITGAIATTPSPAAQPSRKAYRRNRPPANEPTTPLSAIDFTMVGGRRPLLRHAIASAVLLAAAIVGRRVFAADVTITIESFAFSPTPLMVARNTTVTW